MTDVKLRQGKFGESLSAVDYDDSSQTRLKLLNSVEDVEGVPNENLANIVIDLSHHMKVYDESNDVEEAPRPILNLNTHKMSYESPPNPESSPGERINFSKEINSTYFSREQYTSPNMCPPPSTSVADKANDHSKIQQELTKYVYHNFGIRGP